MKKQIVAIFAAAASVMLVPGPVNADVLEGDGMGQVAWAELTSNERVILDGFISPQAQRKAQHFVGIDGIEATTILRALREEILARAQASGSTGFIRD